EEQAGDIHFDLKNHLDIEVYGDVRFYERSAEAQINVLKIRRTDDTIQAASAIEALRAEGLFPKVKKEPPATIRRVGLVTSRSSRAIGDFETTYQEAGRRAVLAPLSWQYTLLEGERAAQSIVDGINALVANPEVDIIVIIRGGGRTENLAPFDELDVLRAIIGCSKYLVTGIGHHRDHVLADDVADYVVATPTAAAIHAADLCMRSQDSQAHRDFIAPRQMRYYKLAFITILIIILGSLALLGYTLLQNP
ncbi:MAG: hypothetical protein J4G18_08280, partial [Anaerolineae bacterium]|nr:hypothetical protein [Anaerolineae bacterium]